MEYGNMPLEGGHLKFGKNEYEDFIHVEGLKKYIRQLIGGEEFLNNLNRYCFWIDDDQLVEAIKQINLK